MAKSSITQAKPKAPISTVVSAQAKTTVPAVKPPPIPNVPPTQPAVKQKPATTPLGQQDAWYLPDLMSLLPPGLQQTIQGATGQFAFPVPQGLRDILTGATVKPGVNIPSPFPPGLQQALSGFQVPTPQEAMQNPLAALLPPGLRDLLGNATWSPEGAIVPPGLQEVMQGQEKAGVEKPVLKERAPYFDALKSERKATLSGYGGGSGGGYVDYSGWGGGTTRGTGYDGGGGLIMWRIGF